MSWNKIETAPKGEWLLVCYSLEIVRAEMTWHWPVGTSQQNVAQFDGEKWMDCDDRLIVEPHGWQHLPESMV